MKLYMDTETYSALDLRKRGTFRYAEECEIMIVVWAVDNGEVHCWDRTVSKEFPEQLRIDLDRCTEIWFHNAMFDYAVLKYSGLLELPINKLRCSMVSALSHGLPGALDDLCEIFKIPTEQAKIKDGKRLIQLFCKPRPKNSKIRRATRGTHPEEWTRFIEYAVHDIEAMRAIHKKLPTWNYPKEPELSLWHLDQVINDRGILIDREHAEATLRAVERAQQRLKEQTVDMTEGRLQSTTQVQATIDYIMEEYGIHTDNLTKAGVKKLLELDIPGGLRALLETRQQAGSSSTAKYQALLNKASSDGRFRGGIQFSGASRTRRAGGRGFQPQNLPSRGLLPKWLVEEGIELMKIDAEDLLFPNTMHLAVSAIRQTLIAPPGMKFCISDLSNIEGRKVAWYANEEWKLKAFREFDAGTGHDLYNLAYARSFKTDVVTVTKEQRAIGKVMELACFLPDTLVLTDNGIKSIVEVSLYDRLWDGERWVKHKGVLEKAARPVVHVAGIGVTEDHLILTPQTWQRARQLASNEYTLYQALEAGSSGLKSLGIITRLRVKSRIIYSYVATAVRNGMQRGTTYALDVLRSVASVLSSRKVKAERHSTGTRTSYRMRNSASGSSIECERLSQGVTYGKASNFRRTADAVLTSASNGAMICASSLDMLSRARDGATQLMKWIGSTITEVTSRVISDSLLKKLITKTEELSGRYRRESTNLSELYDIADAGPLNRFTVISNRGPLIVHNCGYSGGVGAFVTMSAGYGFNLEELSEKIFDTLPRAQVDEAYNFLDWTKSQKRPRYGLTDKAFMSVDVLKRLWRNAHPGVTKLWADLQNAAEETIRTKRPHDVGLLTFDMKGNWLRIRLASGRYLCYPYAAHSVEEGVTFYGVDQYTRKWSKQRTYSGKLLENCIAEGTEVLTHEGWVRIEHVGKNHLVWDGEEWVKHSGLQYSGKQSVISVFSVKMTPEHLVLTSEGWKHGKDADRYNRASCRVPESFGAEPYGRQGMALEGGMCLWRGKSTRSTGTDEVEKTRGDSILRMQKARDYRKTTYETRDEYPPSVCSVPEHGRSLPVAVASRMEELWRAGHSRMQRMEQFSGLLARHVEYLPGRIDDRAFRQFEGVFQGKLSMANAQTASEQHAADNIPGNANRPHIGESSCETVQYPSYDASAQTSGGLVGKLGDRDTGETVSVYDIINCGPRNRFVVRGADGLPLIVHNCCQSSARDVLYDAMPRAESHGFSIVLHVHDELVAEARKELHVDDLSAIMAAGEPWTGGLPLAAAGHESARYCKE